MWRSWTSQEGLPRNKDKKSLVPAKLNAANTGEVARNNLVQSMISIYDTPSLLLFGSGYTHSYMSYRLARELCLKPRMLDPPMIVGILNGSQALVDKEVGPIQIQVQNKSIVWEFALNHLVGIDLILRMDWLSKSHRHKNWQESFFQGLTTNKESAITYLLCQGK